MKARILIASLCLCMVAAQASAAITVYFDPAYQLVPLGPDATVDILADIPVDDATLGWGIDLAWDGGVLGAPGIAIGGDWLPFGAADGDGLAALSATLDPVSGTGIVLATLTFPTVGLGISPLTLSDSYPADLSEGFALEGVGEFADVIYMGGAIETPEPATLALLALGGLALIRRR